MNRIIYDYSYGNEDVLGTTILVYFLKDDDYLIHFKQEGDAKCFKKISSRHKEVKRTVTISQDEHMDIQIIELVVTAILNPPPETLFIIQD